MPNYGAQRSLLVIIVSPITPVLNMSLGLSIASVGLCDYWVASKVNFCKVELHHPVFKFARKNILYWTECHEKLIYYISEVPSTDMYSVCVKLRSKRTGPTPSTETFPWDSRGYQVLQVSVWTLCLMSAAPTLCNIGISWHFKLKPPW